MKVSSPAVLIPLLSLEASSPAVQPQNCSPRQRSSMVSSPSLLSFSSSQEVTLLSGEPVLLLFPPTSTNFPVCCSLEVEKFWTRFTINLNNQTLYTVKMKVISHKILLCHNFSCHHVCSRSILPRSKQNLYYPPTCTMRLLPLYWRVVLLHAGRGWLAVLCSPPYFNEDKRYREGRISFILSEEWHCVSAKYN